MGRDGETGRDAESHREIRSDTERPKVKVKLGNVFDDFDLVFFLMGMLCPLKILLPVLQVLFNSHSAHCGIYSKQTIFLPFPQSP